ncbi:MAG: hypothetical protein AABX01_07415 [Candidatus Micrarchaeota archaeon]
MRDRIKAKRAPLEGAIPLAFIAILAIGILLGINLPRQKEGDNSDLEKGESATEKTFPSNDPAAPKKSTVLSIAIPAVDKDGNGALAEIIADFNPGSGITSIEVSTGLPLISPETQKSLITAVNLARKNARKGGGASTDISFKIIGGSEIVTGRSAGAAIAVLTLAGLEGNKLKNNILITGAINEDGSIGRVGFIEEKATSLNGTNYTTLIVPMGEKITSAPAGIKIIEAGNFSEGFALMTE